MKDPEPSLAREPVSLSPGAGWRLLRLSCLSCDRALGERWHLQESRPRQFPPESGVPERIGVQDKYRLIALDSCVVPRGSDEAGLLRNSWRSVFLADQWPVGVVVGN